VQIPYTGVATHNPFPGNPYLQDVTAPQSSIPTTLGFTPAQKYPIEYSAHGAYPYLPSQFDQLTSSLPPNVRQGQRITSNSEYTGMQLDLLLSSLAEASHHPYTPQNPRVLVSPAGGNYSTSTSPRTLYDAFVTGPHSDISPVHVSGASGSPFNLLGASLTPIFSSTPSTVDFGTSPGLTRPSPAVPSAVRPLTEESGREQALDLVGLFSRSPSTIPYGNFATGPPFSKEAPSAPSGNNNLLTVPLPQQFALTSQDHPSPFRAHNNVPPHSSGQTPYATGRREVRFPNQKKVNVVGAMCKQFPKESDCGKLLERICATEWYRDGKLEPTFGNHSQELTSGLALCFEAGQSVLLGFIGSDGRCLHCGHTSPKRDRIIAHVREHLGLRPFECGDGKCPCKGLPV
jgi:hypothetical protein